MLFRSLQGDLLARAFNVDCEGPNSFAKLARYESALERSIDRCLRQLKIYPAARNTPDPSPEEPHQPPNPAPDPPSTPSKTQDYEANPKNGGTAAASVPKAQSLTTLHKPAPRTQHQPAPTTFAFADPPR